jgi:hypothetical protein
VSMNVHYSKVLSDLDERRNALRREMAQMRKDLEELDRIAAGIQRIAPQEPEQLKLENEIVEPILPILAGMSMRWGILYLLADYFESPLPSAVLADYLEKAGLPNPNGKLRKNVSAVLSRMVGLEEVANTGDGFAITPYGRDMWASIKKSPKYLNRDSSDEEGVEDD